MALHTKLGRRTAALAAASLLAVTAACGGSDSDDSADGITIEAGQFSWTAAELQIEILREIADQYPELGVSDIESTNLDPAAGWVGIQRGDLDFLTEVNLPNQQAFADDAADEVNLVSETYGGAAQGWFVPSYLVEAGGAAEGLTSIDQLNDYADEVGGVLFDADPGWVTTEQNAARIEAFGLDQIEHRPSSEAALIAELRRQYNREEPILIYFYRPHWLFAEFDLVQLEEPNEYEEGCFTDGGRADCAIPTLAAWVGARADLQDRVPEFYALLENFQISLEEVEVLLSEAEEDGADVEQIAKDWVADNTDTIESWIG